MEPAASGPAAIGSESAANSNRGLKYATLYRGASRGPKALGVEVAEVAAVGRIGAS